MLLFRSDLNFNDIYLKKMSATEENYNNENIINVQPMAVPFRKRKSSKLEHIQKYFKVEAGSANCLVDNCKVQLNYVSNSNFKRHIVTNHPSIAAENGWLNETPDDVVRSYTVKLNKNKILINIVKLLTEDGQTMALLSKTSFRAIADPLCDAIGLSLSVVFIQNAIDKVAAHYKNIIKNELKNRIICIKIDGATRFDRNILGMNAQYIENGEIQIRTLSMMEVSESQTAENLKMEMLAVFDEYGINLKQIYTITTDNGANMLKTVRLFDEEVRADVSSNPELEEFLDDGIFFGDNTWSITSIKCATHTLQLCVHDTLKHTELSRAVDKIRTISKKLRKKPYRKEFVDNKQIIPTLDVATRWSSTFNMLEVLLKQQDFITQIIRKHDLELLQVFNECIGKMKEIQNILKPIACATTKLQEEQLVVGDLFRVFLEIEMDLEEIPDECEFRNYLIGRINVRKTKLFESDAVISAIYLDPRFNYRGSSLLSVEQKTKARVIGNILNNIVK